MTFGARMVNRLTGRTMGFAVGAVVAVFLTSVVHAQETISQWTFEVSVPTTAGPHVAEMGVAPGQAIGFHANPATVYSNPVGNGSPESFSSNNWAVGDYYEFQVSTASHTNIQVSWDQTRSSTGPGDFVLQYSTDGVNYTTLQNYLIDAITWSSGTNNPLSHYGPISLPQDAEGLGTLYVRMTSMVGGAATGSNRIDNVLIEGDSAGGNVPPVGGTNSAEVAYTNSTGTQCSAVITAFDPDSFDVLFNIPIGTGSLGGTLTLDGTATTDGQGNWSQPVLYTVPADVRGTETFAFLADDSLATGAGSITFNIRGAAVLNTAAWGASTGNHLGTAFLYTGEPAPSGGQNAVRDILSGQTFTQNMEFDNHAGIRKNPDGNLFGLSFGPPGGPGLLYVYATQPETCTDEGLLLFEFSAANVGGSTRTTGLSVSPNNDRIAVYAATTAKVHVLDYTPGAGVGTGGPDAASVSLGTTVDAINLTAGNLFTYPTAWLDNDRILMPNALGDLYVIDLTASTAETPGTTHALFADNPNLSPTGSVFMDLEYNPEISPHIYFTIGQFAGGVTTNYMIVFDTGGNVVQNSQHNLPQSDTFRSMAFDSFGNLLMTQFNGNINIFPGAWDPSTIGDGATSSVRTWRTAEVFASFSGLDVACGRTIGQPNLTPTAVSFAYSGVVDVQCTILLTATDANVNQTLTFEIVSQPANGSVSLPGSPVQNGTTWTQQALYTPDSFFGPGSDPFTFRVNDGVEDSNVATATMLVRRTIAADDVAYGGNSTFEDGAMLVYRGAHTAGGGDTGTYDALTGRRFTQSVEFDNFDGVMHNPAGNLLGLDFGTQAGGGSIAVYATQAVCNGNEAVAEYFFDGSDADHPLSRVTGLAFSQDNTLAAIYGYDTRRIFVMNYTTGPDVGLGGPDACDVSLATAIDVSSVIGTNMSNGLACIDDPPGYEGNVCIFFCDASGNLHMAVAQTGALVMLAANPRPATAFSSADIEYNPDISPYVYVLVSEFDGAVRNTLYIVDPNNAWAYVSQGGANASYTTHDNSANNVREIAFDTQGNLFMSRFNNATLRTNIEFIPNADVPGSITDDATVDWNDLDADQDTEGFNGLDVALGAVAIQTVLCLPLDMNMDRLVDGDDLQEIVEVLITGNSHAKSCWVDVNADGNVDASDLPKIVEVLNNWTNADFGGSDFVDRDVPCDDGKRTVILATLTGSTLTLDVAVRNNGNSSDCPVFFQKRDENGIDIGTPTAVAPGATVCADNVAANEELVVWCGQTGNACKIAVKILKRTACGNP